MKKLLTVLLAVVMVFALAACGGENEATGGNGKVGALYIGNVNDGGFTQSMNEALQSATEANDLELLIKENLGENDAQAIRDAVTNFIDQGCTIIVGCSFGYGEVLNELANSGDYDDITFLHFSGPYQNETNLENFFGSMEEARYLSGMAAAFRKRDGSSGIRGSVPVH
ncbi:MAG: BMP family ABC transporter substrate-binding protein [Anaerovoracaceae bacterium]